MSASVNSYFAERMAQLTANAAAEAEAKRQAVLHREERRENARRHRRALSPQVQLMDLRCLIGMTLDQAPPHQLRATALALADHLADPTIDIYEACRRAVIEGAR